MSVFKYSKYKIIVDPKSKKTQGLVVGDIVRRQYKDDKKVIYSLMLVLETGTDTIKDAEGKDQNSHYFIGALLDGSEPASGEILDFVRTTNMFDKDRGGALYMTASEGGSPYMDVIDGMGTEGSLCYPYLAGGNPDIVDSRKYAVINPSLVNTMYTPFKDGAGRVFRITKNKVSTPDNQALGLKQMLPKGLHNPQRVVISYKTRSSKQFANINVSLGSTNGKDLDGVEMISVSPDWEYKAHVITIDQPSTIDRRLFINLTSFLAKEDDWFEVADMNITLLSNISGFSSGVKTRVGKISGIIDPVFGALDGYGAYFQNLYASKNVNIAGTLTAGDENGFASTFYVGKIHKNALINSIDFNTLTQNHTIETESQNPLGIGKVCALKYGVTDILAQTKEWLNRKVDQMYCFSFWVKSPDREQITVKIKGGDISNELIPSSHDWVKMSVPMNLTNPINGDLIISIEVSGGDILFTAPQLESGETSSLYQPTDSMLVESEDYGAWFSKGGIGGTIQNPLLKLNEDGSISSSNDSFVINRDGTGHFAGGAIKWTKDKVEFDSSVTMQWTEYTDNQIHSVSSEIGAVKKTADSAVNALGGASFPKLTKISATGIYTGTLTAEQVNAVSIDASSIKTGTLSADRIAVGSLKGDKITVNTLNGDRIVANSIHGDKITAGTIDAAKIKASSITSGQINVANLQAALITVGFIQGLSLNFTKGKIGAWTINGDGIFNQNTKLTAAGSIYNTKDAWILRSDGSGFLANKNISWDVDGNVTFDNKVKLNWTNYTDNKIDSIEVGGRNLLLDSADYTNSNWNKKGSPVVTSESYLGSKIFQINTAWQGMGYKCPAHLNLVECTYSFYIRATKDLSSQAGNLHLCGVLPHGRILSTKDITTSWARVSKTVKVNNEDTNGVRLELDTGLSDGAKIQVCGLKMETGNKNTDWTTAPEDTEKYLTKIDANGIYTGTLTAAQINAVNINASSIKSGTLSADRIAANTLHGNKITSGTITTTQLNVSNIQAALVTVGYIQGLTLNFSKGKIGGWTIENNNLTNGKTKLTAAGSVWHTDNKWSLNADGSGYVASNNIKWDAAGGVTFSDKVRINWTSYTDQKIDEIEIGGKNLLLNSNFYNGLASWQSNYTPLSIIDDARFGKCLKASTDDGNNRGCYQPPKGRINQEIYAWSVWLKADTPRVLRLVHENGNGSINCNVTTEWQLFQSSGKWGGSGSWCIYSSSDKVIGNFYVANAKYEKGNKATDWSPAPEDIDESIAATKTELSTKIDQTASSILIQAKNNAVDEVKAGIKVTAESVTVFGQTMKVDSNLIAKSIEAGNLTVKGGNLQIQQSGTLSIAKGKIVLNADGSGKLANGKISWNVAGDVTLTATATIASGNIGGWTIENNNLTNGKTKLTAAGSVWHTDNKWALIHDGSGYVAGNSIKWDTAGNVTFSGNVQAQWKGYTDNAKQELNVKIDKADGRITSEITTVKTQIADAISNKIRYIRDWQRGNTINERNHWVQVQAFNTKGVNVALNKTVSSNSSLSTPERITNGNTASSPYSSGSRALQHITVDLGAVIEVDSVQVWHYYQDGRSYKETKTEVSSDGVVWRTLYDSAQSGTWKATSTGKRFYLKDSLRVETELSTKISQAEDSVLIEAKKISQDAKNGAVNEVKAGLQVNPDGINVFGKTFKVDANLIAKSISTGGLLVGTKSENSTYLNVSKIGGFDMQGSNGANDKLSINSVNREILLLSPRTLGDESGDLNPTKITISSDIGGLRAEQIGGDGRAASISANGIFSNSAKQPIMFPSNSVAAISAYGFGNAAKGFNNDGAVVGVFGLAKNSGTGKAYGGYFHNLRANGFSMDLRILDNSESQTMWLKDGESLVIGAIDKTRTLMLPKDAYLGTVIWIKNVKNGELLLKAQDGEELYAHINPVNEFKISNGQTAMVICLENKLYSPNNKNKWVVSKFGY